MVALKFYCLYKNAIYADLKSIIFHNTGIIALGIIALKRPYKYSGGVPRERKVYLYSIREQQSLAEIIVASFNLWRIKMPVNKIFDDCACRLFEDKNKFVVNRVTQS